MSTAAAVAFFALPACIFVHELGHLSVAAANGWERKLFATRVVYYEREITDAQRLLFLAAGPLIDVLQMATGLLILRRLAKSPEPGRRPLFWFGTVLAFVSFKWLLTPVFALSVPGNDERQISEIIGLHTMALPALTGLAGAVLTAVLIRTQARTRTLWPLTMVLVFGGLGAATWEKALGPLLFPL